MPRPIGEIDEVRAVPDFERESRCCCHGWDPLRITVLEFEDIQAAPRWYESEQYQA